ncbi:hypothetical protein HAX54_018412 [Datura stramonium]|uniref:Uncharacterized protein n=1 Tax=Datura stramonium TaxID=4076 RepID=A0ABS8S4R9_DATST|nr:hypothetical protein [Datura stramonium]
MTRGFTGIYESEEKGREEGSNEESETFLLGVISLIRVRIRNSSSNSSQNGRYGKEQEENPFTPFPVAWFHDRRASKKETSYWTNVNKETGLGKSSITCGDSEVTVTPLKAVVGEVYAAKELSLVKKKIQKDEARRVQSRLQDDVLVTLIINDDKEERQRLIKMTTLQCGSVSSLSLENLKPCFRRPDLWTK